MMTTSVISAVERDTIVRRGRRLSFVTVFCNSVEGVVALAAGLSAGSVALVGFGVDSGIELAASAAAIWRLDADAASARRVRVERISHRMIGLLFVALALYIAYGASDALIRREAPSASPLGIAVALASLVIMPYLARAKRQVGSALGSRALISESAQTSLCSYLSAILLGGLLLNALLGWWWADPVAALVMVPIIGREGAAGLRIKSASADDCCS
jgi:divalent metal cation (Fe/Co/Zn/Cd) transporter